jgi:Na+/H+-dicarboxylate symporter
MSQDSEENPQPKHRKGFGFTTQILVGVVLGVLWGLFFGEYGSWIKWFADAFIALLQMSVLPYVTVSLVCNVGRLSFEQGGKLAKVALLVQVLLWSVGFVSLGMMGLSYPEWEGGSFFCTNFVEEPETIDWIELFIPSNPFWSLANNAVPAVVLFSIGLGAALIPVSNKELLLDRLDVLLDGLGRLNRLVVRMSPLGMFAILGHTAGTLSLEQFGLLQGYLLVYGAAALLLSLWVLPSLIAGCTPFSHRDVLLASRDVGGSQRPTVHGGRSWHGTAKARGQSM